MFSALPRYLAVSCRFLKPPGVVYELDAVELKFAPIVPIVCLHDRGLIDVPVSHLALSHPFSAPIVPDGAWRILDEAEIRRFAKTAAA